MSDFIKCPNYECKSNRFILLSEERYPAIVDECGNIVSIKKYMYKCSECFVTFTSNIGPLTPSKKILKG